MRRTAHLAALQVVHLLKAGARHERKAAHLLLEPEAELDGRLDALDLNIAHRPPCE